MVKQVLLKDHEAGAINVFDINDKLLMSISLSPGLNEINLCEVPLQAGSYTYRLIINEKVIETKTLIIVG